MCSDSWPASSARSPVWSRSGSVSRCMTAFRDAFLATVFTTSDADIGVPLARLSSMYCSNSPCAIFATCLHRFASALPIPAAANIALFPRWSRGSKFCRLQPAYLQKRRDHFADATRREKPNLRHTHLHLRVVGNPSELLQSRRSPRCSSPHRTKSNCQSSNVAVSTIHNRFTHEPRPWAVRYERGI